MPKRSPSSGEGISRNLYKVVQKNPFVRTKAKNDPHHVIANEFLPTNSFWDLFATTNQVVLGSRGTGKTMLMRSMCPSVFCQRDDIQRYQEKQDTYYVGFWVPFELRWITQIKRFSSEVLNDEDVFELMFNCRAFCSLCREIDVLVDLVFKDQRKKSESFKMTVVDQLVGIMGWEDLGIRDIHSFQKVFGQRFLRARSCHFKNLHGLDTMKAPFLEPCQEVTEFVGRELATFIENDAIVWVACLDEGEYLDEIQLKIINTIMRSDGVSMTIKFTTLPGHYTTLQTLKDHSPVKSGGHDFSFLHIDFDGDSPEFKRLCDELVASRLRTLPQFKNLKDEHLTLRRFLGSKNNKSLSELCLKFLGKNEGYLNEEVRRLLTERSRKKNYDPVKKAIDRYIPIVAYKYLEEFIVLKKGGRKYGVTESGADRIKLLTEGNLREFLRIMARLYETATRNNMGVLKQENQHFTIHEYIGLRMAEMLGMGDVGLTLKKLLENLKLHCQKVFNISLLAEGGKRFPVSRYESAIPDFINVVRQGVASGYFTVDKISSEIGIRSDTDVKIASWVLASFRVRPRNLILKEKNFETLSHWKKFESITTLPLFKTNGGFLDEK